MAGSSEDLVVARYFAEGQLYVQYENLCVSNLGAEDATIAYRTLQKPFFTF